MDLWQRAKSFAEEAAKKSQELTIEAAKRSQALTRSANIADLVTETAKKSREIAAEASKTADLIKIAALKQADQIKSLADGISPQILTSPSPADSHSPEELQRFGVTDDLRDFVKGLTSTTFQSFPLQGCVDEQQTSDVATISNVRKDLTEWQEKHATIVLTTVKEISRLRYELCPRTMKEWRFWKIYFTLVSSHVAPYEKRYMEEVKLKEAEQMKEDKVNQTSPTGETNKQLVTESSLQSKGSASSSALQDLDTFLLGDLEDSDDGPDDADGGYDDDFGGIDNEDADDEDQNKKTAAT